LDLDDSPVKRVSFAEKRASISLPPLPIKEGRAGIAKSMGNVNKEEETGNKTQRSELQSIKQLAPGQEFERLNVGPDSELFDKDCYECKEKLFEQCVSFGRGLQKRFLHLDCFFCSKCGDNLGEAGESYWMHKNNLLCRTDYLSVTGVVCKGCDKVINDADEMIRAMNHVWHQRHFVCTTCSVPLEKGYYKYKNRPYCANHIAILLGIKCASCGEGVVGGVKALSKVYHEACFKCASCGIKFGDDGFFELNGAAYCKEDAIKQKMQLPTCAKCDEKVVDGVVISALEKSWHAKCFRCNDCGDAKIAEEGFYSGSNGLPVCKLHRVDNMNCAACGEPLGEEEIVSALGKKFHERHFVCHKCKEPFDEDGFYDIKGQPYCKKHAKEVMRSFSSGLALTK
jgi:hypothetical protein